MKGNHSTLVLCGVFPPVFEESIFPQPLTIEQITTPFIDLAPFLFPSSLKRLILPVYDASQPIYYKLVDSFERNFRYLGKDIEVRLLEDAKWLRATDRPWGE